METLRGAWDTALAFLTPYYNQTLAFLRTLDSVVWWTVGGVLLVLFLLWLLLRRREPRKDGRPEVLLSLGTIAAPDGGVAGTEGRHLLRLTVSNLNTYAVQVLELALKTPRDGRARHRRSCRRGAAGRFGAARATRDRRDRR